MGQESPQQPEEKKRITYRDIPPRTIKPSHLSSNMFAVFAGDSDDRPDDGTEKRFWFSTDTKKLSYWTGSTWVESAAFS